MLPPIFGKSSPPQKNKTVADLSSDKPKSSVFSGEYKKATTSIYRAQHNEQEAATSVFRIGKDRQIATTSITRKEREKDNKLDYDTAQQEEKREESRYSYIRRLIIARKNKDKK